MRTRTTTPDRLALHVSLGLVLLLAACEASGLDMALAHLAGGPAGFAWRDHWLLTSGLHAGGRALSWLAVLLLCVGVWWPRGWLARLPLGRRVQLALGTLLCVLAVSAVKSFNATSCPWDLSAFGGLVHQASHWQGFLIGDGGSGHCFPAGHASAGFAFVGGYFVFRHRHPAWARAWLAAAAAGGLLLGLAQQLRGAHFMSHTLWTAALCWAVSWSLDRLWPRWEGAL